MKTVLNAIEDVLKLLVSIHKREIDNKEFYLTQVQFDNYVAWYCQGSPIDYILSDEELKECALSFITYDGGDYLLNSSLRMELSENIKCQNDVTF